MRTTYNMWVWKSELGVWAMLTDLRSTPVEQDMQPNKSGSAPLKASGMHQSERTTPMTNKEVKSSPAPNVSTSEMLIFFFLFFTAECLKKPQSQTPARVLQDFGLGFGGSWKGVAKGQPLRARPIFLILTFIADYSLLKIRRANVYLFWFRWSRTLLATRGVTYNALIKKPFNTNNLA